MSNALAIATVTQALVNQVAASLPSSLVNGWQVTTFRPDNSSLQGPETTPRVNIFLYQVTPNVAFRNADLPTRRADGSGIQRSQLALDLHYLLTFYGDDQTLEHQRMLGAVARYLHANPVLSRAELQTVETTAYLASHLSSQSELVRFTASVMSLDDMSKLWAAFPQTDFVLSMAYLASVVLLQTDDVPPGPALPVITPRVLAIPFSLSTIISVFPQSVAVGPTTPGAMNLSGTALAGNNSVAFMTPGATTPLMGTIAPTANNTLVPVTLPTGLRPGINSVQLMQTAQSPLGPPPEILVLSRSNTMTFMLLPTVVSLTPSSPEGSIQAVLSPPVGPDQQVSLILSQMVGSQTYTLPAAAHTTASTTLTFSTSIAAPGSSPPSQSVPTGTYLVRVQVDTAQSSLTIDGNGKFNGPTVIL